jgi:hypothetical protein
MKGTKRPMLDGEPVRMFEFGEEDETGGYG